MALRDSQAPLRRQFDIELDKLERRIEELRILYEQYFVDVQPHPPTENEKQVNRLIRELLKAPFKNSANRFRLRTLINRYQTYCTYWERINKQREEGTYSKDVFKAELREKMLEEAKQAATRGGKAEQGLRELFSTYESALKQSGAKIDNLNFDSFKKSLIDKAKHINSAHGVKKLQYKVVVKNGKVSIKASGKE